LKLKQVLIICNENSCRSQIAEALVNEYLRDEWKAFSAGLDPSSVNLYAIKVMAEIGIDISRARSKSITEFLNRKDLDLVITVCDNAKESCPLFPSPVEQVHISFPDPAVYKNESEQIALPRFRQLREQIKAQLLEYLKTITS
jgi:arsenate reductase